MPYCNVEVESFVALVTFECFQLRTKTMAAINDSQREHFPLVLQSSAVQMMNRVEKGMVTAGRGQGFI